MEQPVRHLKGATKQDLINFIYNSLYEYGWKTTFNYRVHRPRKFFGRPLQIPEGCRSDFFKYANYCYLLSLNYNKNDEAARYEDRYGLGIYFSVVLYWLLVHFGVASDRTLRFCQGYFSYRMENGSPNSCFRAGLHAWLSLNGAIIDVTIWRQKDWFDFAQRGLSVPVIQGEIPEGLNFFGFEEEKSLAKEYARRFARESGMTFFQWVNFHREQANLLDSVRALEQPQS